jgi:hypothetical protein
MIAEVTEEGSFTAGEETKDNLTIAEEATSVLESLEVTEDVTPKNTEIENAPSESTQEETK